MKLLIIKLSSLGDVVHTFPALTDAVSRVPGLTVDWAVEEAFVPLVRLHPAVRRAIPVPLRRLRKQKLGGWTSPDGQALRAALAAEKYDLIIDAQGLMKSAIVSCWRAAGGTASGGARRGRALRPSLTDGAMPSPRRSTWPCASASCSRRRSAIRWKGCPSMRALRCRPPRRRSPISLLLHGTTWDTKTWTVVRWRELARIAHEAGLACRLFAVGETETARAQAIVRDMPWITVEPPTPIDQLAPVIAGATGVVAVDSGLGHLAAALGIPTVGLYGPTNPRLTGLYGPRVLELRSFRPCAPCEKSLCKVAPHTVEGPPCMVDHAARDAWRSLNVLRFGHADAMDRPAAPWHRVPRRPCGRGRPYRWRT